jgi:hypothetical protein
MNTIRKRMGGWMRHLGWRRVLGMGVYLVLCVGGLAAWWRTDPYRRMENVLHAGMSAKEVIAALGEPRFDTGGDMLYQKRGASTMLLLIFTGPQEDTLCEWWLLDAPWREGYTEYKVRKHEYYGPGGLSGGPGGPQKIVTTIDSVDFYGQAHTKR